MATSLSNLNDNLAEGTHKIEKDFETKGLSEYHDWYVQSDTFLKAEKYVSQNI